MSEQHPEERRVVVNDRRRIDPETGAPRVASPGAARPAAPGAPAPAPAPADETKQKTEQALAERTADLQRITAEYANYRKRVDRDRAATVEAATGAVLAALLPVLDDIDRARQHGDLTGAFKAVADQLEATLEKLGLQPYGEAGERFDPTLHEAVAHQTSAEVTEPTCVAVFRRGYKLGDRLLRVPLVAVAEPGAEPADPGQDPTLDQTLEPTPGQQEAAAGFSTSGPDEGRAEWSGDDDTTR